MRGRAYKDFTALIKSLRKSLLGLNQSGAGDAAAHFDRVDATVWNRDEQRKSHGEGTEDMDFGGHGIEQVRDKGGLRFPVSRHGSFVEIDAAFGEIALRNDFATSHVNPMVASERIDVVLRLRSQHIDGDGVVWALARNDDDVWRSRIAHLKRTDIFECDLSCLDQAFLVSRYR